MSLSRADLHVHTNYSDGLHDPEAVINYAVTKIEKSSLPRLRVVAITDHNTIDGALVAQRYWKNHRKDFSQIEMIVGEEVSSKDGHILGLFLHQHVPAHLTAAETVDAIHAQGGLAIAAHPFTHLLPFTDLKGVGRLIAVLPLDGVEVRNSIPTELYANWLTALYNRRHARHTPVGGSDCHYLPMLGRTFTWFEGLTAEDLRQSIQQKRASAGGRVNGPITVAQLLRDQIRRRHVFFNDHQYRLAAPALTVNVSEGRGVPWAVVYCIGQIVRDNADILKQRLAAVIEGGFPWMIVELAGVDFIDSAGLGVFIAAQKRARAMGGNLTLCCPKKEVAITLKLVRLDLVFGIHASMSEALATFSRSERGSLQGGVDKNQRSI